ncbi:MAG: lipopolysaccharide heptosyltransferase I, partial [Helicobacter sp.]|nr:lipopolysaccharide heptosyltransferase I [Helicobacter sp.]
MLKPIKIAFIRLSAMGDLIHSASILPLLFSALQSEYEPVFHWYVDEIFCEVLEDSPFVHKLFSIPLKKNIKQKNFKYLLKLYKQLKVESYDMVIDMQGLLKSSIVGWILRSKYFVGFDFWSIKEPLASFFYTQKVSIPYQKHILLRNAVLGFGAFNLPAPSLEALLCPKEFISANKNIFPIPHNGKKVLLLLETSKQNKTYPKESFFKLVMLFNSLGITPFLLTHKEVIDPE